MNDNSTMEELQRLGIGRKIRTLREEKGVQIEALAQAVDVGQPLLSQIESDIIPPTLATLLNISRVLNVKVDYFFADEISLDKIELTRVSDRLSVAKSRESDPARLTYNYQALSYRLQGKQMEPFLVEFDSQIEEQPVALPMTMRSPKSWVSSLAYGVSPHPAQAPENSSSGW